MNNMGVGNYDKTSSISFDVVNDLFTFQFYNRSWKRGDFNNWRVQLKTWGGFFFCFFLKFFIGHKSFSWGHWYICFGLLVMSALDFKAWVGALHAFSLVWSSDSPLVGHLLTWAFVGAVNLCQILRVRRPSSEDSSVDEYSNTVGAIILYKFHKCSLFSLNSWFYFIFLFYKCFIFTFNFCLEYVHFPSRNWAACQDSDQ